MIEVHGIKVDRRTYMDRNDLILCLLSIEQKQGKYSLADMITFLKEFHQPVEKEKNE